MVVTVLSGARVTVVEQCGPLVVPAALPVLPEHAKYLLGGANGRWQV